MEARLDSLQGQFSTSFPNTFKDFFTVMNEDEDHLDLFSNLLENKMIPRANKFNQRRSGGSLRCTSSHRLAGRNNDHTIARASSFRMNRNHVTIGGKIEAPLKASMGGSLGSVEVGVARAKEVGSNELKSPTSFCKHIKYCCLHQNQLQQQPYNCNQPSDGQQTHFSPQSTHDYGCSSTMRVGPDGEDSGSCGMAASEASKDKQLQHPAKSQQPKRHSIILERAFDFDVSCDESDSLSTNLFLPPTNNAAYKVATRTLPVLKQPQHSLHHQRATEQQQKQQLKHTLPREVHRVLPQPPKAAGPGVFHTKETALHRIQQQCGLTMGSRSSLVVLSGAVGTTLTNNAGGSIYGSAATTTQTSKSKSPPTNRLQNAGRSSKNLSLSRSSNNYSINHDGGDGDSGNSGGVGSDDDGGIGSDDGNGYEYSNRYIDLQSPTATPTVAPKISGTDGEAVAAATTFNSFDDQLSGSPSVTCRSNLPNIRSQKSPILSRRRASSIAASLLATDMCFNRKSPVTEEDVNARNHTCRDHGLYVSAKSTVGGKSGCIPVEGGVLTFQQAMSGAVSPQYSAASLMHVTNADAGRGAVATAVASTVETADAEPSSPMDSLSSKTNYGRNTHFGGAGGGGCGMNGSGDDFLCDSTATITQLGSKQRQRLRTSSMPAESRKPRLADTRRSAIHGADIDLDYYRLRSFSITSHGVCNLGDSLRSRRSRSINSVTSTGTSNSGTDRHNSNASRISAEVILEQQNNSDAVKASVPAYKIAMLGASGVGKTTLSYQFTTSDYICAYDLSLDDDYGQKTVSVLVDGVETDLEIIDHPACEMSTEAFCSTYNVDLFVVVYSVVDRSSFKAAEKVLQYLKENEMLLTRGAILVGNKMDLERHREVNRQMGRKVAKDIACKFIETSSGLDHNVDELLVGIVAQVKLNPQRIRNLSERDRQRLQLQTSLQKHRRMHIPPRCIVRQMSMCQPDGCNDDDKDSIDEEDMKHDESRSHTNNQVMSDEGICTGSERTAITTLSSSTRTSISTKGQVRKTSKRTLNLESILKMGESEQEDDDECARRPHGLLSQSARPLSKFELLSSSKSSGKCRLRTGCGTLNFSPKSRQCYDFGSFGSGCSRSTLQEDVHSGNRHRDSVSIGTEGNLLPDCNRKTVSKLTTRTKVFLSSVLRFKKAISMKRRNSSSCSDLFVI